MAQRNPALEDHATFTFHTVNDNLDTVQTPVQYHNNCRKMMVKPRWWRVNITLLIANDTHCTITELVYTSITKNFMSTLCVEINDDLTTRVPLGWCVIEGRTRCTIIDKPAPRL